jgi:2'-5' RNA ligase
LRAFVAVDVPEKVLDALASFQGELSATGADIKLVERESLHFTVKFLGEISDSQGDESASRLARLALEKVDVEVSGVGAFPDPGRPRVVWAGVGPGEEALVAHIAREVSGALEGIGELDERPFRAHLTLARVRSSRNSRALGDLLRLKPGRSFGQAILSELKLKSSVLTPRGPVYKDIGVFPLR